MLVKDGDGVLIDFQWPSVLYLFRAGAAVTCGVVAAAVVLWWPLTILYLMFINKFLELLVRAIR